MNKLISATAVAAAFLVGSVMSPSTADADKLPTPKLPASMSRPCGNEGMNNCYWDAKRFGNGQGKSYVVREFPGSKHLVCVMYVAKRDRWLDYCE